MSNFNDFSLAIASELYKSNNPFPVDFDDSWPWVGYSRKDSAKRNFLACGFIEGVDYVFHNDVELGTLAVPRPEQKISMTVDCLTHWAMMAGTEQGKYVRIQFIEVAKKYKKLKEEQKNEDDTKPKLSDIDQVAKMLGSRTKNNETFEIRYISNKLQQFYPALAPKRDELPAIEDRPSLPLKQKMLIPTQIAAHLGLKCKSNDNPSPIKANELLVLAGYQEQKKLSRYSNSKKKQIVEKWYEPTKKAIDANLVDWKPLMLVDSAKDREQLQWSSEIVGLLKPYLIVNDSN